MNATPDSEMTMSSDQAPVMQPAAAQGDAVSTEHPQVGQDVPASHELTGHPPVDVAMADLASLPAEPDEQTVQILESVLHTLERELQTEH